MTKDDHDPYSAAGYLNTGYLFIYWFIIYLLFIFCFLFSLFIVTPHPAVPTLTPRFRNNPPPGSVGEPAASCYFNI